MFKKKIGVLGNLLLIILCFTNISVAQQIDISTPQQTPFSSGQNIDGWVQGSINEPTGKVTFSEPLAAINSRTVSYNVALSYSGELAFNVGAYTNKYAPTGTVGVGFSLGIPKIVVDNRGTAAREDDVFYLQDGVSNSKLIGINRIDPGRAVGQEIWEFEPEKYIPSKIQYYRKENYRSGLRTRSRTLDYWVITNQEGMKYTYGRTQNSRENLVAWGNWIGNSNQPGGFKVTQTWNLYKIEDQWGNNLRFEYELQESTVGGVVQTEASYIKEIVSSTGERIQFIYAIKNSNEYYEPNKKQAEPDAYQERYEKKYLTHVDSYDSDNKLIYRRNLNYTLVDHGTITNKKRYLININQENKNNEILPNKSFEYYLTGDFRGGLKKVTYPLGGSVIYEYKNKLLFTNYANRFTGTLANNSGYNYYGMVTRDNYTLTLYKSISSTSGNHTFKVNRNFWNGNNWETDEFVLPYTIKDEYPNGNIWLENFSSVFGSDYYGFLHYEGTTATLDLFHLSPNGREWKHTSRSSIDIGDGKPSLLSGNNFVAIGTSLSGKLYTYTWNGNTSWDLETIDQTFGKYHYGAANNYIISLNRKVYDFRPTDEKDYLTNAVHEDYYYMHYLDFENKWRSKSWSASADPLISGIEKDSYFYPSNAMCGFVADDNPELFLRWSSNYNLSYVDNVIGAYDDRNPIINTYSGMCTLQGWFYQNPLKMARFNGINWIVHTPPSSSAYYAKPAHGEDFITFQNHGNNNRTGYAIYNPNSNTWNYSNTFYNYPWYLSNDKLTTVNPEFMVSGKNIYSFTNTSSPFYFNQTLPLEQGFVHTDGVSHAFAKLVSHIQNGGSVSENFEKGLFIYKDKRTNRINTMDLGKRLHMSGPQVFAGSTPFISPRSLYLRSETSNSSFTRYLYRVIDDRVNNQVKDIVVGKVIINNGASENRISEYRFSDPSSNLSNSTTFYGSVIVENKGYGTASIGTVEKKYNNGSNDLRLSGLLLQESIKSTANTTVNLKTNRWRRFNKSTNSYSIKLIKQEEYQYLNGGTFKTVVENSYDSPYYLNTKTKRVNSSGQVEETLTRYAYSQYSFMEEGNFLSQPYEIISKIDDQITSVGRTLWVQNSSGKVYTSEISSGTEVSNLRTSYSVERINTKGEVEESTNGKKQLNTILYGYNYRYPIASFSNATYNEVVNNLSMDVGTLQNLDNITLKNELVALYSKLPNAMIEVILYDNQGKILERIDNRQEITKYFYDKFNRVDYITDHNNKVLKKNIYNYKTE